MQIQIPTFPWRQIGGDMSPDQYGGTIATADGHAIELLKIQPVRDCVGSGEAAEVGFPFWTREAYFTADDLDPSSPEVLSALRFVGLDEGEAGHWLREEATPEERAIAIAEARLDYGHADEGPAGWPEDLPDYTVAWSYGQTETLRECLADEASEFRREVLGEDEEDEVTL